MADPAAGADRIDVRLRSLVTDDADVIVASQAVDATFAVPGGRRREQVVAQIAAAPTIEKHGMAEWGIEAAGALVGTVQVRAPKYAAPPGVCEIGVVLFAAARGRGLGRRAVELATAQLVADGWSRVEAATAAGNGPMQSVLARVGYRCEGLMRSFAPAADGGREDYQLWAVTADDWPPGGRRIPG